MVERREQHGRPPQCRNGRPALSRKRRHRLCRSRHRRPPGNLAAAQQALWAWLRQQYYERTWNAPSPAALNAALNVLEAQAEFDGPQRKVSVRLAEQDGLIYLDLADEFWRCIEIGANGWRIAEEPPVRFRRSAGMQPLPPPMRGGSIELLAPFLNLANENDFMLVVAWLLGALRAGGPYPVLAIA